MYVYTGYIKKNFTVGKISPFLRKNKQIFDIYNFKKALKSVRLIRKVISSCFAAHSKIFLARKSNNLIFSSICYVSFSLKIWNVFFVFRR